MMAVQCDSCLRPVAPEDTGGWLAVQRVGNHRNPVERMLSGGWLSSTPEPAVDPLATVRHFCTAECLVAYVNNGCRHMYDIAPRPA